MPDKKSLLGKEVSISSLPEALAKRLNTYLEREYPYTYQRQELRRATIFKALDWWLAEREKVESGAMIMPRG